MSIRAGALRETVTLFSRTETGAADRYGTPTMVESAGMATAAAVQPVGGAGGVGATIELEQDRDTRISRYIITVLPDAPVNALSRVVWRGRSFEVIGEPREFSTSGNIHHYEVTIQEILG